MSADTANAESCILHKNINTKVTNVPNAKAPRKQRTGFAELHARTTCNETDSDKHHKCIWCSNSHVTTAKRKKRKSKRAGQTILADANNTTNACTCERGDTESKLDDTTVNECISELPDYHEELSVLESSSTDSDCRNENNIVTDINGHQIGECSANHESGTADVIMVSTTDARCFEDKACQGDDVIITKLDSPHTRHQCTHDTGDALLNGPIQLSSTLDNRQQEIRERDVNGNEVDDAMSSATMLVKPEVNGAVTKETLKHETNSTHGTSLVNGEEDDIVRDTNTLVSTSVRPYSSIMTFETVWKLYQDMHSCVRACANTRMYAHRGDRGQL